MNMVAQDTKNSNHSTGELRRAMNADTLCKKEQDVLKGKQANTSRHVTNLPCSTGDLKKYEAWRDGRRPTSSACIVISCWLNRGPGGAQAVSQILEIEVTGYGS